MASERLTILVNSKGTRVVKRNLQGVGSAAQVAGTNVQFLKKALAGIVVAGVVAALAAATGAAIELADAMAEVSTLLGDVPEEMAKLTEQTMRMAVEFGSLPVDQARGFYQVISAGASNAAEATDILRAANKLAVGGVTDVATAADGLTTALNAFKGQIGSATDVSDAMFVAMKAGKTTIGELSASIGKVAPLAAQAGVGFDEMLSALAALTKGGISTREAVTGVRAIVAAVVKPTKEASDLAKTLGINFSAAGLKSMKFAGFLEEVIKKTGGSTEAMAQLFGGVEALVPILALAGGASGDFADNLEAMKNKAGETQVAFDKMANSPGFQLKRLLAAVTVELVKIGNVGLPALVKVVRFLADNMDTIAKSIKGVLIGMLILSGPKLVRGLLATVNAVRLLSIAMAANPIGAIVTALALAVGLFIQFKDQILFSSTGLATLGDVAAVTWERMLVGIQAVRDFFAPAFAAMSAVAERVFGVEISGSLKGALEFAVLIVDRYVALWTVGFLSIVRAGLALPEAFSNFGAAMANAVIDAIEFMVDKAKKGINAIIRNLNFLSKITGFKLAGDLLGFQGVFDEIEDFKLERFEGTWEKGGKLLGEAVVSGITDGWNNTVVRDTILGGLDSIVNEAEARAQARAADAQLIALAAGRGGDVPPALDTSPTVIPGLDTGGGGGDKGKGQLTVLQAMKQILEDLRQPMRDLLVNQEALQLLFDAGKISADEFKAAVLNLNVGVSSLDNTIGGGLLNGLQRIAAEANNIGQSMSDFVVGAFDSATDAIVEFARTGKLNLRQFFQDLFSQLLKLAANQLFQQLIGSALGGASGGGGGFAASLLGGLPGAATGADFTVGGDSGSTDSQLVAFRATKGERVTVKTPSQQAKDSGGGGQIVVSSPPVNVAVVFSHADVQAAFDNPEGDIVIVEAMGRQATAVKSIAQG